MQVFSSHLNFFPLISLPIRECCLQGQCFNSGFLFYPVSPICTVEIILQKRDVPSLLLFMYLLIFYLLAWNHAIITLDYFSFCCCH